MTCRSCEHRPQPANFQDAQVPPYTYNLSILISLPRISPQRRRKRENAQTDRTSASSPRVRAMLAAAAGHLPKSSSCPGFPYRQKLGQLEKLASRPSRIRPFPGDRTLTHPAPSTPPSIKTPRRQVFPIERNVASWRLDLACPGFPHHHRELQDARYPGNPAP